MKGPRPVSLEPCVRWLFGASSRGVSSRVVRSVDRPRGRFGLHARFAHAAGSDIWFDNTWYMHHLPPETKREGLRFRQDIFRWLYEYRKVEYGRTQIDLLQIKPQSLLP